MLICQHVQDRNSRLQQALSVSQLDLCPITKCTIYAIYLPANSLLEVLVQFKPMRCLWLLHNVE